MRYTTAALLGLAVSLALPAAAAGAEYTVNSTTDRVDSSPGNGTCRTSAGNCTLRAAVQEANARPGADSIRLRSGTHQLTIAARGTNGADSGDLDVTGPTTFAGAGATASVVSGRALDRVLELHVAAGDVTLSGLTIREARVSGDGGAIASRTSGRLRLDGVRLLANVATGRGAGVDATAGRVEIAGSTLADNTATLGGGGVHGAGAVVAIDRSTLARNGGGGVLMRAGAATIATSTLSANRGGSVRAEGSATARLDDSTVAAAETPALAGALSLRNTVVAAGAAACSAPLAALGGNVDAGLSCGLERSGDPLLAALADNGAATQTHALRPGSAAIGAGVAPCPLTDQRGTARPQGGTCDAGAYELVAPPPDAVPPDTRITAGPADPSATFTASFAFNSTETGSTFECRLDGADWAPCVSPRAFAGLAGGAHAFEVRAIDAAGNVDATPARHAWSIDGCLAATASIAAAADAWLDQGSPSANLGSDATLKLQSKPDVNWRAAVRFALPAGVPDGCVLDSAKLRLWSSAGGDGARYEALRFASEWQEGGITWANQPATTGGAASTYSGEGYLTWNVTALVQAILDGAPNHGFLIRDALESSPEAPGPSCTAARRARTRRCWRCASSAGSTARRRRPAPPVAGSVTCGQELTRSIRLTNSLTSCGTGDGLVDRRPPDHRRPRRPHRRRRRSRHGHPQRRLPDGDDPQRHGQRLGPRRAGAGGLHRHRRREPVARGQRGQRRRGRGRGRQRRARQSPRRQRRRHRAARRDRRRVGQRERADEQPRRQPAGAGLGREHAGGQLGVGRRRRRRRAPERERQHRARELDRRHERRRPLAGAALRRQPRRGQLAQRRRATPASASRSRAATA